MTATTTPDARPFPRLADDPFAVLPVDEPATSTPSTPSTTRPAGVKRARPATGNRANPTHAPRFLGPAGVNAFRSTMLADVTADLPTGAVTTWLMLWTYADDAGRATVSNTTLAKATHMSRRHVVRMTKELADRGLLAVLKRGSSQSHTPNLYRLHATPTTPSDAGG